MHASDSQEGPTKAASQIGVSGLRLIFQWPLVLDSNSCDAKNKFCDKWIERNIKETVALFKDDDHWQKVEDPLTYPPSVSPEKFDGGGYAQFAYFHDFVQKFLFPTGKNPAFHLFERTDIEKVDVKLYVPKGAPKRRFVFTVERLSLHIFTLGTTMMTLELNWKPRDKQKLTLADTQDIVDYIRRTYTPFWKGKAPQRVPKAFDFRDIESSPVPRSEVEKQLATSRSRDIRVFDHWRALIEPLKLLSEGGLWRDPSDERMPINSLITLESDGDDQKAMLAIRREDWVRLADAEKSGKGFPYNEGFIWPKVEAKFYDRFFPCKKNDYIATRHIIDAAHYCVVGVGKFSREELIHHFRRHYALLSMIARFEFTALLAISSRLTNAVIRYEVDADDLAFEDEIIAIQGQFLRFVHRYRFTGVSSQLQPSEMFAMWRTALGLDDMFADVQAEVNNAFQRVTTNQQKREAEAAAELNKLAAVGVLLGLIAGVMGANLFVGQEDVSDWKELAGVAAAVMAVFAGGLLLALPKASKLSQKLLPLLGVGFLAALVAAILIP